MPNLAELNKAAILEYLRVAIDHEDLRQSEVLQFLADECGLGATPKQIELARDQVRLGDELELCEAPLKSETDNGFWILTWSYVQGEVASDKEE